MKANVHPQWNHQAKVTCACGSVFVTGSMQEELHVDICSKCHPFFTGEMRFVDRQGRVDKFLQKMQNAQTQQKGKKSKSSATKSGPVLSYQDILRAEKTKTRPAKSADAVAANA